MNKLFRYERELVKTFQEKYFLKKDILLINEMKIRWGNIDLVEVSDVALPFSQEQCRVLSKPSCAKVFMRLKNKKLLSKQKLFAGLGLSESTFNRVLLELQKENLIVRENNNYRRAVEFVFPNVVITGYEAKLTDYHKALFQARVNKQYVDYSYMVFPMDVAENIMKKYGAIIDSFHLGLIGVSHEKTKVYIKPKRDKVMKPYVRLMNLVISNDACNSEGVAV